MDLFKQLKSMSQNTDGNLCPHAPYSVSEQLLSKLVEHIAQSNGVLSIHNQETASEDEFFKTGGGRMQQRMSNMNISTERFVPSGKSSLETLIPKLPTSNRIQLVHNTFSIDTDIQHAIEHLPHVFWCLCPSANQYIESKLPPLKSLRANHCEITVGTDSLASNHQLDLLAELRLLQQADPSVTSDELIRWSTLNGARLLGFDSELGSFSKGKKPGIVLIEHVDKINALILPESTSRML
jgi:cytosine/adenosine deaminase-related metal-dependent hydrolase